MRRFRLMPLHGYSTDRHPPTVADHLLAHPFELGFAAWGVIAGSAGVLSAFSDATVSASIDRLPDWLAAIVGVMLVIGGLLIWRGLLDDSEDLMVGWRFERVGLILSMAGWGGYGFTVAAMNPGAVLSWSVAPLVVAMFAVRYRATRIEERRIRKAIR
jgi:protein-S-isoprenylcysteine O-methyltransferase Ste14